MKKAIFHAGPYLNGNRPKPFLMRLTAFYIRKALISNGGKKFNPAFGTHSV